MEKCGALPHIRQQLHESTNKSREQDLLATLDSTKMPPGATLFYGIDLSIFSMNQPRTAVEDAAYEISDYDDEDNPGNL